MVPQVVDVGAYGCEDVLVAPSGPPEGWVFTGTADGGLHRVSHDGREVVHVGAPAAGRWVSSGCPTAACSSATRTAACSPWIPRPGPRRERPARPRAGRSSSATTPRVADDGTVYASDQSSVHPVEEWKTEVPRSPAPAALYAAARTARPPCSSTACSSRTAWR